MTWWSKGRVDGSYDTALCVSFREVFPVASECIQQSAVRHTTEAPARRTDS